MTPKALLVKPLDLEQLHLRQGTGTDVEHGVCVMQAVAYVAGEDLTDHPTCASPSISGFLRSWNDGMQDSERQSLKQYIEPLVGSKGSDWLEVARAFKAVDWSIRVRAAAFLEDAGLIDHATNLRNLHEIKSPKDLEAVVTIVSAAGSAARSAARSAAYSAAYSAARSAADSAARSAADSAAYSAALSAAGSAALSAADSAALSAAGSAALSAALARLERVKLSVMQSAHELVRTLLSMTEADGEAARLAIVGVSA